MFPDPFTELIAREHQESLVGWAARTRLERSATRRSKPAVRRFARRARTSAAVPVPCPSS